MKREILIGAKFRISDQNALRRNCVFLKFYCMCIHTVGQLLEVQFAFEVLSMSLSSYFAEASRRSDLQAQSQWIAIGIS